jgi:branched-chain amino acid transport system substrate-binding protein
MVHSTRTWAAAGVVAAVALVGAGCSSSGSGSASGSGSPAVQGSGGTVVKIGLLTDATGVAASANITAEAGLKAGVVYAARHGYTVKYVVADSQTNPSAVTTAARKLVTQDRVTAVVAVSALTQLAAPYFTAHHVPVIGSASDGPEWAKSANMFAVTGALQQTKVDTSAGKFFKSQGVTTVGTLGYGASPQSAANSLATAQSAKAAGLKIGYTNANFTFGSTNVAPVAIAMKNAGVDGVSASASPNTSFALITALRDQGVDVKASLLPDGYGGDLYTAGAGAAKAAQGVSFALQYEPVELQTAASQQFSADLKAAGVTGAPTFTEYNAYTSVGLLVRGLKAAGGSPSSTSLTTALTAVHDWDAMGLFGGRTVDINDRENIISGADNCIWITTFQGTTFHPVAGNSPVCGSEVKGVTVKP